MRDLVQAAKRKQRSRPLTDMNDPAQTTNPPPASPPPPRSSARHPLDLPFLVGGLLVSAVAIVLLVIGVLAFSSASSARDDSDRFTNERRSAEAREVAAEGDIDTVVNEGNRVADQVDSEIDAANQVTQKDDELTTLLDDATDQFNAGDENGANAKVNNEGRQILIDEQNLKTQASQALAQAQDAQAKLKEALT
jgi:hypothetical protein